jgi:hypothetical protein
MLDTGLRAVRHKVKLLWRRKSWRAEIHSGVNLEVRRCPSTLQRQFSLVVSNAAATDDEGQNPNYG